MKKKTVSMIATGVAACLTMAACGNPDSGKNPPEFDATKLPYYVADTDSLTYSYTDEERIQPFWQGNVMRNEQLMIVEKDGVVQGKLLYPAEKVLSVRDWALEKEYQAGIDYVINGNTITLPEGSSIPVFKDEWSHCQNIPSQYPAGNAASGYQDLGGLCYTESSLIWGNYIHVSYVYDPELVNRDVYTKFNDDLYGLHDLFATKEEVNLVVIGDSISEGCSASELWGHAPHQPYYSKLVAEGIEQHANVKVNFTNLSVGGKDSSWGAEDEQLTDISDAMPDILIVGFGTNDSLMHLSGNRYKNNIRAIIDAARIANPNCQIVLLAPFASNPESKAYSTQEENVARLEEIIDSGEYLDVTLVNMYELTKEMLETKNYYEIAGNNINHPNDFIHRVYAMNILSAMFDLENSNK